MTPIIVSGITAFSAFSVAFIKISYDYKSMKKLVIDGINEIKIQLGHNTNAIQGGKEVEDYFKSLISVYTRVMRGSEKEDNRLVYLQTNRFEAMDSMIHMFCDIGVDHLEQHVIRSKLSSFKAESERAMDDLISPEFTEHFRPLFRSMVKAFSVDLCRLIDPNTSEYRFNNITQKFKDKSRDFMEDVLIKTIIHYEIYKKETINAIRQD